LVERLNQIYSESFFYTRMWFFGIKPKSCQ
jgi:hypothetical protein